MTTLAELMGRDDVRASWFYTHTENGQDHGRSSHHDFDMYDVVFSIDNGDSLYGVRMNRKHVMFSGIAQAPALSRQNQGDRLVTPDPVEVLAHVIADAHETSEHSSWVAWASDRLGRGSTYHDAVRDFEQWQIQSERHSQVAAWLGDEYGEYVKAAQQYVADH